MLQSNGIWTKMGNVGTLDVVAQLVTFKGKWPISIQRSTDRQRLFAKHGKACRRQRPAFFCAFSQHSVACMPSTCANPSHFLPATFCADIGNTLPVRVDNVPCGHSDRRAISDTAVIPDPPAACRTTPRFTSRQPDVTRTPLCLLPALLLLTILPLPSFCRL